MKLISIIILLTIFSLQSCKNQNENVKTIQIIKHNDNYFEVNCGETFFEYTKENCGADCMELLNDLYECKE